MIATTTRSVPVGQEFRNLAARYSQGPESLVELFCDAILHDVDTLCALAKKHGVDEMRRSSRTVSWTGRRDGQYLGFGLGDSGWLNLGFLKEPVARALQERFRKMATECKVNEPEIYNTMLGPFTASGELYVTKQGCYELSHTYTWFVKKRVD